MRRYGLLAVLVFALLNGWSVHGQTSVLVRTVSLSPNLTEMVFAMGLGRHLVGRSSACDYPPEALELPVVGGFGRPNLEVLHQMHPDLVLLGALEKPGLAQSLQSQGCQVLVLPCESWTQMMSAARGIAGALQAPQAGAQWVGAMEDRRRRFDEEVRAFWGDRPRPRMYVEVWSDPLTTAGGTSFLNEVVELCGGINLGREFKRPYVHASAEWVVRENPDAILLVYETQNAEAADMLRARAGWANLHAVTRHAICDSIPPELLARPGPRLLDGAQALFRWLQSLGVNPQNNN